MTNKIRAIITDLDGTLLPKNGEISGINKKAFEYAQQKGYFRIIATGRNLYSSLNILLLIFQSITWYFLQEQEFSAGQTKSSYFPGIWN